MELVSTALSLTTIVFTILSSALFVILFTMYLSNRENPSFALIKGLEINSYILGSLLLIDSVIILTPYLMPIGIISMGLWFYIGYLFSTSQTKHLA